MRKILPVLAIIVVLSISHLASAQKQGAVNNGPAKASKSSPAGTPGQVSGSNDPKLGRTATPNEVKSRPPATVPPAVERVDKVLATVPKPNATDQNGRPINTDERNNAATSSPRQSSISTLFLKKTREVERVEKVLATVPPKPNATDRNGRPINADDRNNTATSSPRKSNISTLFPKKTPEVERVEKVLATVPPKPNATDRNGRPINTDERNEKLGTMQPNATDVGTGHSVRFDSRNDLVEYSPVAVKPTSTMLTKRPSFDRLDKTFSNLPSAIDRKTEQIVNTYRHSTVTCSEKPQSDGEVPAGRLAAIKVDKTLSRTVGAAWSFYDDMFYSWGVRPPSLLELLEVIGYMQMAKSLSMGDLRGAAKNVATSPVEEGIVRMLQRFGQTIRKAKDGFLYGANSPVPRANK